MKTNLTIHCVVKNEEKWIWFALRSILDIADKVLVYDTGSSDRTVDIIKRIKSKKIIFEEKGEVDAKGLTQLRKDQLKRTKTEWFLILDGDEIWPKNTKKELVEKIISTKVDWRSLLRDFLSTTAQEDWNFARPNTRFEDTGFLMPSLHNEKAGHIVFAADTSGSINSQLLAEYIAEAQQALDELSPEKLTVIYCDAAIQAIKEYEPGDKIDVETVGRGGTDFRPVFDHFNKADELPKVLVYLTDLCGDFPTEAPEYPVLWITEYDQEAPFGETIKV